MKIFEVSEFSILPYTTQNRKLGNLGNMSLPSNSGSSYKSRFQRFTSFRFCPTPKIESWKSWKFCLPRILTLVMTQGLKTPKKWTEAKTKMFRYDLERNQKFPRFPSFRFCPTPKIENLEILEILFTSNIDTVCNSRFKKAKEMNWDKN